MSAERWFKIRNSLRISEVIELTKLKVDRVCIIRDGKNRCLVCEKAQTAEPHTQKSKDAWGLFAASFASLALMHKGSK